MKKIKIAIVDREDGFPRYWKKYMQTKGLSYEVVDIFNSDIISTLSSIDILLWNWELEYPEDALVARHIIYAAELMDIKVFPDSPTCWSYDDKLAQKYLLEAVGAPLIPTYAFFDIHSANEWIRQATFPKVFKLRKGAGSKNVILIKNASYARAVVKKSFGKGFKPAGRFIYDVAERFVIGNRKQRLALLSKVKRIPGRLLTIYRMNKYMGRERGYAYFQDFIPNNTYDIRITIVNCKHAFGFTRDVRRNDFRASGSGNISYDRSRIPLDSVKTAFDVAKKLKCQSIAFDFLIDAHGAPVIAEISYCYVASAVYECSGHWDDQLFWHEGHVWPTDLILEQIIEDIRQKNPEYDYEFDKSH